MNSKNISREHLPILAITGRILVCCPGGIVTGGPELLHQLVHELRNLGHNAYICYYPFDSGHECPDAYADYNSPQARFRDQPGDLVILPEVRTILAGRIRHADVAIWWLSVDNYFGRRGESWLGDAYRSITSLALNRLSLRHLANRTHLVQSAYARDFLARSSITSCMLTDYLSREHFESKRALPNKSDIIAYNPRKGISRTRRLIESNLDLSFVPIHRMTKNQVSDLLSQAKIYIDFGNHPGKDRLPREAAMAGCCIITGKHGAAENAEDIPIPIKYKLNDKNPGFLSEFKDLAHDIIQNFEEHSQHFEDYRASIRSERSTFKGQVISIFGKLNKTCSPPTIESEE